MHDIHKIASIKQVSYRHSSYIGFIRAISGAKLAQFFGTTYLALRASLDLSRQKIGLILVQK